MPPVISDALIFVVPVLAGLVGSRQLSRSVNFCLMVAVFQLDVMSIAWASGGRLRPLLLVPYTVVAIVPPLAGLVSSRYVGKTLNVLLIIAVFYVSNVLLALAGSGQLRPLTFLQGIFFSPVELLPPLVFVLVARLAHRV